MQISLLLLLVTVVLYVTGINTNTTEGRIIGDQIPLSAVEKLPIKSNLRSVQAKASKRISEESRLPPTDAPTEVPIPDTPDPTSAPTHIGALSKDVLHHWNFDEGPDWHDDPFQALATTSVTIAFDVANDVHASLVSMTSSNWVSGKRFTALLFGTSGNNDQDKQYLSVTSNLAGVLGSSVSLSLWLKTSAIGGGTDGTSPGVMGRAGSGGTVWGWLNSSGKLCTSVGGSLLLCTSKAINDNEWHHIVFSRESSSGEGTVYVDGVLDGSSVGITGDFSSSFSSIGRVDSNDGASATYFTGTLDQIHIFEGVVSGNDVKHLYSNHAPKCWDALTSPAVSSKPCTTVSVLTRCFDVERNTLTVHSWTTPSKGTVVHNGDGSFTYNSNNAFSGFDEFIAVVHDGSGGFYRGKMKIQIMDPSVTNVWPYSDFTTAVSRSFSNAPRVPRLLDWNKDGLLDLLVGELGYINVHLNEGSSSTPSFSVTPTRVQGGGADIYAGDSWSTFTIADMDGDGAEDIVLSDSSDGVRVYRNTAGTGQTPVYASYTRLIDPDTLSPFIVWDRRIDVGDWDGDGRLDLLTGAWCGDVRLYMNEGDATQPVYRAAVYSTLFEDECYNWWPRLYDINQNGAVDLVRGINWGSIVYYLDPWALGIGSATHFSITYGSGETVSMKPLTNGPVVDFGDLNGDGLLDVIIGADEGSSLFVAFAS